MPFFVCGLHIELILLQYQVGFKKENGIVPY